MSQFWVVGMLTKTYITSLSVLSITFQLLWHLLFLKFLNSWQCPLHEPSWGVVSIHTTEWPSHLFLCIAQMSRLQHLTASPDVNIPPFFFQAKFYQLGLLFSKQWVKLRWFRLFSSTVLCFLSYSWPSKLIQFRIELSMRLIHKYD